MNRWLHKFMEKPDISDKFDLLDKKMENMHGVGPDKTDRFDLSANMSDLSGRPLGFLDEKLESMSEPDISDGLGPNLNMSVLSGRPLGLLDENFSPYDEYDFDERLSIAEHEGGQTPAQAQKIAYLDAFISVLKALPATASQKDWLDMRIQTALAWMEAQEYRTIN